MSPAASNVRIRSSPTPGQGAIASPPLPSSVVVEAHDFWNDFDSIAFPDFSNYSLESYFLSQSASSPVGAPLSSVQTDGGSSVFVANELSYKPSLTDAMHDEGESGADVDMGSHVSKPTCSSTSLPRVLQRGLTAQSSSETDQTGEESQVQPVVSLSRLSAAGEAALPMEYAFSTVGACAARKHDVLTASLDTLSPLLSAVSAVIQSAKETQVRQGDNLQTLGTV